MFKKYDISGFIAKSEKFENKIIEAIEGCKKASLDDNIKNGFDLIIEGSLLGIIPYSLKVDIKFPKRETRYDDEIKFICSWLEYRNVVGNEGSLLKGADLFGEVFKDEQGMFLSFSTRLERLALFKQKAKEFMVKYNTQEPSTSIKDYYTVYRRPTRKDVIMKVKSEDILSLEKFRIYLKDLDMEFFNFE